MAYSIGLVNAIPVDLIWMGLGVWEVEPEMSSCGSEAGIITCDPVVTVQPTRQAARLQPNGSIVVTGQGIRIPLSKLRLFIAARPARSTQATDTFIVSLLNSSDLNTVLWI